MSTHSNFVENTINFISAINSGGGLKVDDFPKFDSLINDIVEKRNSGTLSFDDIQAINHCFGLEFLGDTLQGMALLKPEGYAGDFKMIDMIYTNHLSGHPVNRSWDVYFQSHEAPRAVRNRKRYFVQAIRKAIEPGKKVSLLNLASGPGRDLLELYQTLPDPSQLITTCIELDENAISYSKALTTPFANNISYQQANVLRFSTPAKYDFIWSAGLFDYFDDKTFIWLLKRFFQWINPGSLIIIGNFNADHNPSRGYMEIFGEWFLHHRTEEQLMALAIQAGFSDEQLSIGREPENVNLFLHIEA